MAMFNEDKSDVTFYTKTEARTEKIPRIEAYEEWIAYWRANIHRFVEDYLGIKLRRFQEVLIYSMDNADKTIIIATRGMGKSFITAVYAVAVAILYPNSKIVVITKTMKQAERFISEKIETELVELSPVFNREVERIGYEDMVKTVWLKNGSIIKAANLGESTRGMRATVLILDEAVQLEKTSLESVGLPLLNQIRYRPFAFINGYENYPERLGKEIYLTSGWFKAHYFYKDYFLPNIREMMGGLSRFCLSLSHKTPVRAGILPKERIDGYKKTMTPMQFAMEIEGLFYGENADAFFSSDEVGSCRVLKETFLPPTKEEYILRNLLNDKTIGTESIKKVGGEFRVLSADIALQAGRRNDNSVYSILRNIPNKDGKTYTKELVYMESHNGLNADLQALYIKRLFYTFDIHAMIIDANGIGMTVYNELKKETVDEERGTTYPAWGSFNEEGVNIGTVSQGVHHVMYTMKATAQSNSDMALKVKSDLNRKLLLLPSDESELQEYFEKKYNFSNKDGSQQAEILRTYRETRLLFMEMINLEYVLLNNLIKIKEKSTSTKDRYSSLAYGVYLSDYIIEDITPKICGKKLLFFS